MKQAKTYRTKDQKRSMVAQWREAIAAGASSAEAAKAQGMDDAQLRRWERQLAGHTGPVTTTHHVAIARPRIVQAYVITGEPSDVAATLRELGGNNG